MAVERVTLRRDPSGRPDHPDQLVQIGTVPGPGRGDHVLLQHDRAEVVYAQVQRQLADILAGGEPGRLQVRDVVQEQPGHREEPQILQSGRLRAAFQVVVLRLVGPWDERPESALVRGRFDRAGLVSVRYGEILYVADHADVLDPLGVRLAGAHHHGGGGRQAVAVRGGHDLEPPCAALLERSNGRTRTIRQHLRARAGDRVQAGGLDAQHRLLDRNAGYAGHV